MRREIALWKVLAAVLAVLATTTGGAVALAQVQADEPVGQAPPDSRGTLSPERSTTYVPLTPCRIYSTTGPSIAPFGVEETRSIKVGGDLSGQGGNAAGCGVPVSAVAIEAAVSATFNQGDGYLRVWPAGESEPQATFVNYTETGAATNTGAIRVQPTSGNAMSIKNYRSVTDVVIDVQGYYVRPMWVLANPDGTFETGSRLFSVVKNGTGQYRVDFQADTDTCSRQVTVGRTRTNDAASGGFATAHASIAPENQIQVQTFALDGSLADRPFLLEVTC